MIYEGIGPNRGRVLESDGEALDYAMASLGLAPLDGWDGVDTDTLLEYFDPAAYLSGNWAAYRDWGTYYAENPKEAEGFEEPGEADGWIV